MNEIWENIPNTEYSVSNMGRVGSRKYGKWRMLRPSPNSGGYLQVGLCVKGRQQNVRVHHLVAAAFLSPKPTPKHEINHIDGVRTNPRVDNLEWVTRSGNQNHRYDVLKHGAPRGEAHGWSKLTEGSVRDMRRRCAAGEFYQAVATDHGVCKQTVCNIVTGKTWGWLKQEVT